MKKITNDDLVRIKHVAYTPKKSARILLTNILLGRYIIPVLNQAERCFDAMYDIRRRARRNHDYYRGKQWGDIVEVNGKTMTEEGVY